MPKYAEIIIPQKINGNKETLTYLIPNEFEKDISEGSLVEVPLKKNRIRGVVYKTHNNPPSFATKPIERIINDFYHLSAAQIKLLEFIHENHFCPLFKSIKLFYPSNVFTRKRSKTIDPPENIDFKKEITITLSSEQQETLEKLEKSPNVPILLHGVTSSGKTEIYKNIVDSINQQGRQSLILIPEISLTPQTVNHFYELFGKRIAILHSKITPLEKLKYLTNIARGEYNIVIGPRSAIFAPFKKLGIIIIDEEHEDSYKQDQAPRYHAREIAEKMAEIESAQKNPIRLIFGSATPSIDSYYLAQQGKYNLIEMNQRYSADPAKLTSLPKIHVVDLREEIKKRNYSIFSDLLLEKISNNLKKKEQTLLFLNRRGNSSAILCRDCGHTEKCKDCDVTLTYHSRVAVENTILPRARLICHHCGKIYPLPQICSKCGSALIKYIGIGTQKIEDEITSMFPQARVMRADSDTTKNPANFEKIYHQVKNNQLDILIGTQMIAKGLHLPNVTLVGVVLADTGLAIPDFRAAEKTFQILTQVAGRSGRKKPGEVVIQTYLPDHYAIQKTLKQDYKGFFELEIKERRLASLPPFSKLIKLTIEDTDQENCYLKTNSLNKQLQLELHKQNHDLSENKTEATPLVEEISCFPAMIGKLKKKFRWHILLRGNDPHKFLNIFILKNSLKDDIKIDVNPLNSL